MGLLLGSQILFFMTAPFLLQYYGFDTLNLPSFGWATGWLLAYTSVGAAARVVGSKQRAFAQNALGKYLPRSVAAEILKDPELTKYLQSNEVSLPLPHPPSTLLSPRARQPRLTRPAVARMDGKQPMCLR